LSNDPPVAGGRRAEVQDTWNPPLDSMFFKYNWQILIPTDWVFDNVWTVISQCHVAGMTGKPPSFAIEVVNSNMIVKIRNDDNQERIVYSDTARLGVPLRFYMDVYWSATKKGRLVLKMNDNTIVDDFGANYYSEGTLGPYFKCGLYISGKSKVIERRIKVRLS